MSQLEVIMEQVNETKQIAATIFQQLGGKKFAVMTGAKHYGAKLEENGSTSLSFKIGRNSKSVNYVKISLNDKDLYDISFMAISKVKRTLKASFKDLYCDQLVPIFEQETGMHTSLGY